MLLFTLFQQHLSSSGRHRKAVKSLTQLAGRSISGCHLDPTGWQGSSVNARVLCSSHEPAEVVLSCSQRPNPIPMSEDSRPKMEPSKQTQGVQCEGEAESDVLIHQHVKKPSLVVWEASKPFVYGGIAGMAATSIIQPFDFFKVRLQLVGEGTKVVTPAISQFVKSIIKSEGLGVMYTGLSAALLRQATYTTARMGIFRSMSDALSKDGKPLPFHEKAASGLVAGALGSFIGNPADLSLLRMQADGSLPLHQRRNYKNAFDALWRIVKEEGAVNLWRGAGPTVTRAMAVNCAMLAAYDQTKEAIIKQWTHQDSFEAQLGAGAVSGLSIAVFSLPFDFIKTRIQKMKPLPNGQMPYQGSFDCMHKVLRTEGIGPFYRGFATYYMRCAPHAMLVLLFVERLKDASTYFGI